MNEKARKWKREYDATEKENKRFLTQFRGFIKTGYGERCQERVAGCVKCQIWSIYDVLATHL